MILRRDPVLCYFAFAILCHAAPRHLVRLDMIWIWYQLLPNFTICNQHANTHPCIWYQLLPNPKIRHLNLNTHPCGSCTRNAQFVVRSKRSEIFIVFLYAEILGILNPADLGSFIVILAWHPGDPGFSFFVFAAGS